MVDFQKSLTTQKTIQIKYFLLIRVLYQWIKMIIENLTI